MADVTLSDMRRFRKQAEDWSDQLIAAGWMAETEKEPFCDGAMFGFGRGAVGKEARIKELEAHLRLSVEGKLASTGTEGKR